MPIKPPRHFFFHLNTMFPAGLAFVIGGLLLAVFYPVYVDGFTSDRLAYHLVLAKHKISHFVHHNGYANDQAVDERQPSLLYLSWFPYGDPRWAHACTVSAKGATKAERIVWNNGTGGGEGRPVADPKERAALEQLAALPPGLDNPDDVTYGRLLIVTSALHGNRVTRYYDRAHLPASIRRIVHTLHLKLSAPTLTY